MKIKYRGRGYKANSETKKKWFQMAKDYNDGLSIEEIAAKYVNDRTGKNYNPRSIYQVLKSVAKLSITAQEGQE